MATNLSNEETLAKALSIISNMVGMGEVIDKLRGVLNVDHVVYTLARPAAGLYIQLTYPAAWVKRYINQGYAHIDPISRAGSERNLPFDWDELPIQSAAEELFLTDALSHGIGPHGFSIPMLTNQGYRALFSISSSRSEDDWDRFLTTTKPTLIEIASRLHRRVELEIFGNDQPQ